MLQLIDSLEAGGAERMAVNYANSLASRSACSALVVTRKEGILKEQLSEQVRYSFIKKRRAVDFAAVRRLKHFVKENGIEIVHAHGTSFFTAALLKMAYPKIRLVWHDHHGGRAGQKGYKNAILKVISRFFDAVIVVNNELKSWASANLSIDSVLYLPNYAVRNQNEKKLTVLKGEEGKRIVCLSNLRNPKNHIALLDAFLNLELKNKGWSLHLVGKDSNDAYSFRLKEFIRENKLEEAVFIYGSAPDIYTILDQATVGVLASLYEGFPVTLLEYGLSGLAVVSTNVGYCGEIIQDEKTGLAFDPANKDMMQQRLERMTADEKLREQMALGLAAAIRSKYSEEIVMEALIQLYQKVLDAKKR